MHEWENDEFDLASLPVHQVFPRVGRCCIKIGWCKETQQKNELLRKKLNQIKMQDKFLTSQMQKIGIAAEVRESNS